MGLPYEVFPHALFREWFFLNDVPETVHDLLVLALTGKQSYGDIDAVGVFGDNVRWVDHGNSLDV